MGKPGEVVQPVALDAEIALVAAEDCRQLANQLRRRVADAVHPTLKAGFDNRLGDQARRVGEVKQNGVFGGMFFNQAAVVENRRNGAHRHGESARPGGLLAQRIVLQGDTLVADPALIAADPQGGDHIVAIFQRRHRVAGHAEVNIRANSIKHIAGNLAEYLQVLRGAVEKYHFR